MLVKSKERPVVTGKTIFCLAKDGPLIRSVCLKAEKSDKSVSAKCDHCGKEVWYLPYSDYQILKVACCVDCERAQEWQTSHVMGIKKELARIKYINDHPELNHLLDEGDKTKTVCEHCGVARGFGGFKHAPECPKLQEKKEKKKDERVPNCPECGGKIAIKGYHHKPECPQHKDNKMKAVLAAKRAETAAKHAEMAKDPTNLCPDCGGIKKGRGFSHKEGCKRGK
jgi:DNA-directed RNA polymerase subunit RPC12/RpoP